MSRGPKEWWEKWRVFCLFVFCFIIENSKGKEKQRCQGSTLQNITKKIF